MRVLLAAADVVGARMAGVGMRACELAGVLAAEHDVTLLAPGAAKAPGDSFRKVEASRASARSHVTDADVVIAQGSVTRELPALLQTLAPLVIDLYDPYLVEGLEAHRDTGLEHRLAAWKRDLDLAGSQLSRGDFFVCASERQRHFWLGALAQAGRINPLTYEADATLRSLLDVVPFGVQERDPEDNGMALQVPDGIAEGDELVIWGGGVWNWLDPLTLIEAATLLAPRRPRLRLLFMGTQHPNPSVPRMRMLEAARARSREAGLLDTHVFFKEGWVPYGERGRILCAARVAVSLHPTGLESEFAFRTRALDYIWARLPMVVSDGDELASLVRQRGLGIVVPPGNSMAVAEAIDRLLEDAQLAQAARTAAGAVREDFRWSRVAEPLRAFCRTPHAAADRELLSDGVAPAPNTLAGTAWRSLRSDGLLPFIRRSARYTRRRLR